MQTMKGRASVRATGSMGMWNHIARGRDRRRSRTAEEMMAEGSQKLEPSQRERESRRRKVVCMRTYLRRIRKI